MGRLRGLFYRLRHPAFAIPVLTLGSLGLVAGLGRLVGGDWLLAIVSALGVLLAFLLAFLLWSLLAREHERRLQAGLESRTAPAPEPTRTARGAGALDDKFIRGLADWGRSGSARHLPWYLVLGESGAGKTSALADSGLELPADTSRFFEPGPTRSFSWWPTNQAILIDTAGRYVADEDGATRREWRRLLRLIRRHGRRVPLQGIVVAVSLRALLSEDEAGLQASAHRIRHRLNEVSAELRIDAPIYVLCTQADAIEGLCELASALPHGRLDEALGWTNPYRRFSDPAALLRKAFRPTLDRIERLLPDALMREADPVRRRRLFLFPSELEVALERIGGFLDRAFGRSVYGTVPFLRGLYLTSAAQGGQTCSAYLERLGHGWAAHGVDGFHPQRGLFQRDLFRRILVDREEATLAAPARELGPTLRRALLGATALASVAGAILLGSAFASNLRALRGLERDLAPARIQRPSLGSLDALRLRLEAIEAAQAPLWRRMGLYGPLRASVDAGRRLVADRFEQRYERPAKARLLEQADRPDAQAFAAISVLALDSAWLGSGSEGRAPDLTRFVDECPGCGPDARAKLAALYSAWARWSPERARARALEEQQVLSRVTPALLTLANVDRWCAAEAEVCRPVRLEDFGLPVPAGCGPVRGAYTQATWDRLIAQLVSAVRTSGRASQVEVERFLRDYRRAYVREWERFASCIPETAKAELPEKSAYLGLLARMAENTGAGSQWSDDARPPAWFGLVETLATEDVNPADEAPAGARYRALLQDLSADVERVRAQPASALPSLRSAARDPENPYQKGLALVKSLVPLEPASERQVRSKLRTLLAMPVLNGFSATLAVGRQVVDRQWGERIVSPYGEGIGDLASLRALYDPESGALAEFEREWLSGLYERGSAVPLVGGRRMGFGRGFRNWLESGRAIQRGLFANGVRTVRVESFPGDLLGRPGVYLTDRTLELECPEGVQSFRHSNAGSGRDGAVFRWTAACDVVRLKLETQSTGGARQSLPERTWTGPLAFVEFLREADREGGRYRWELEVTGGVVARVEYRVTGADSLLAFESGAPPRSVAR